MKGLFSTVFLRFRILRCNIVQRLQIAVQAVSDDLQVAGRRRNGNLPEIFPFADIGDMDFHFRYEHAAQRVMDRIAVVRKRSGIDDYAVRAVIVGLLQAVDDGSLVIALEVLDLCSDLTAFLRIILISVL